MKNGKKAFLFITTLVCVISLIGVGILVASQVAPIVRAGGNLAVYGTDYQEEWTLDAAEGNNISIDLSSVDVVISPYDGDAVLAHFVGKRLQDSNGDLPYISAESEKGILRIRTMYNGQAYLLQTGFFEHGNMEGVLTLQVPRWTWGDIDIDTFDGDVDWQDGNCTSATIKTSSGSINLKNIASAQNLSATAFAGDIDLQDCSAEREVAAGNSSGNIALNNIVANSLAHNSFSGETNITNVVVQQEMGVDSSSGSLEMDNVRAKRLTMDSFSGDIHFVRTVIAEDAHVSTSSGSITGEALEAREIIAEAFSGDIDLMQLRVEDMNIKTSSGAVDVEALSPCDASRIETFSGSVSLWLPADMGFTLYTNTFSGDVDCAFAGKSRGEGNIFEVGNMERELRISTSSGDISVEPLEITPQIPENPLPIQEEQATPSQA